MEKLGGFERKRLSDISNLQGRPKPMNLDSQKNLTTTITPKEYIDKLQKENKELVKLLEDRNELIELSVVELRKLRINFQKVQLQNSQLAQANSQMLAELNTGKDRLKVLQHDLACQNGLLKARKVLAGERKKRVAASQKLSSTEVESSLRDELRKSCQEDVENEPKNGNQRTMKQSLGCPSVKPAHTNEEANKKRRCSRRQSARLKTEDAEATEDSFDVNNGHCAVPSLHDDPVGISGQISAELSAKNENEGHSASENACLPLVNVVDATKKRRSRRESARFVKTVQPEATEDSFVIEDGNLISASGQITPKLSANLSSGFKTGESRRSSVGRPLRGAAEKVHSYQESSLRTKMRRPE